MARFKVNVFHLIASACSLLLIGYLWFVFLPSFEVSADGSAIKPVVILVTILLLLVSGIQIFLAIRRREEDIQAG